MLLLVPSLGADNDGIRLCRGHCSKGNQRRLGGSSSVEKYDRF